MCGKSGNILFLGGDNSDNAVFCCDDCEDEYHKMKQGYIKVKKVLALLDTFTAFPGIMANVKEEIKKKLAGRDGK
jgi:hypothetical protein